MPKLPRQTICTHCNGTGTVLDWSDGPTTPSPHNTDVEEVLPSCRRSEATSTSPLLFSPFLPSEGIPASQCLEFASEDRSSCEKASRLEPRDQSNEQHACQPEIQKKSTLNPICVNLPHVVDVVIGRVNEHRSVWAGRSKFTATEAVQHLVSKVLKAGYDCDAMLDQVDWLAWQIRKESDRRKQDEMRKWFKPSTIFALWNFQRRVSDMEGDPMPDKDTPPSASPWAGVVGW